jgi:YcxB-like protein
MERWEASYFLTREDAYASVEWFQRRLAKPGASPTRQAVSRVLIYLLVAVSVAVAVTYDREPWDNFKLAKLIGGLVIAAFAVFPWGAARVLNWLFQAITRRRLDRSAVIQKLPLALCVTMTEEGIRSVGSEETTEMRWPDIEALELGTAHVFMLSKANVILSIPRRAFASDAEFGRFFTAAKERFDRKSLP